MKRISLLRFNALAGYARKSLIRILAKEVGWFELPTRGIVGAVIQDRADGDYGGVVFARDAKLRFRWVDGTPFMASQRRVEVELRRAMEKAALAPVEDHHQGDEKGAPVDFFFYTRPKNELNPSFVKLAEEVGFSPAREIIELMMRWHEDTDGNFVEQFQTSGFDQRIWELYLFAALVEMGHELDSRASVPDFLCSGMWQDFAIEAVTVGPTKVGGKVVPPPAAKTDDEIKAFLQEYMPIKFGSALFSKLKKAYWERPNVAGKSFALAIQDFSSPLSMVYTRSAFQRYVFGYDHDWHYGPGGELVITPRKISEHTWEGKTIPSGFFDQPGAENISAVLFSNSGTISKFNRMGITTGFGSGDVFAVRRGTAVNHDPNASGPVHFAHAVNSPDYVETWTEGLDVFHNPKALLPLDPDLLPGAAHLFLRSDGQVESLTPDWEPLASTTMIAAPVDVERMLQKWNEESK